MLGTGRALDAGDRPASLSWRGSYPTRREAQRECPLAPSRYIPLGSQMRARDKRFDTASLYTPFRTLTRHCFDLLGRANLLGQRKATDWRERLPLTAFAN